MRPHSNEVSTTGIKGGRRWLLRVLLSLGTFVLLTQYINCSDMATETPLKSSSSSSLSCDEDCISSNSENLEAKVNLGANGLEYQVKAGLAEFNLGGDCNEGGYPYNSLKWELWLAGYKVRHSDMLGMVAGGQTASTVCINGRFLIYVNLTSIPEDPVDRSGLKTGAGAARAGYDLYVEIFGRESNMGGAQLIKGGAKSRTRVALIPIL